MNFTLVKSGMHLYQITQPVSLKKCVRDARRDLWDVFASPAAHHGSVSGG